MSKEAKDPRFRLVSVRVGKWSSPSRQVGKCLMYGSTFRTSRADSHTVITDMTFHDFGLVDVWNDIGSEPEFVLSSEVEAPSLFYRIVHLS